jgi:hypothetical protein
MSLILSGTDGLSDVDGSASTPAIRGTDTNTGIFFPAADTIAFAEGGAEVARFDSSGNLGIGTTSPSTGIGAGNLGFVFNGGSNGVQFKLQNTSTGSTATDGVLLALDPTSGAYLWNYENSFFAFGTNNTERMRILSDGRFAFNTTTAFSTDALMSVSLTSGGYQVGARFRPTNNGTYYSHVYQNNALSTVGYIEVGTSSTSYVTSSDYRLKENIAPMTGALAKVALLKPVTYTWKSSGEQGQGFIAHELQAVVPDCVSGEKDAVETVDIKDEDGNVIGQETKPVYQGIDTSFLVATLTAAIQELKAELDGVKAELATLKA